MSGLLLLERLSDADLAVLSHAAGDAGPVGDRVRRLRSDPPRIHALLARPEVFDALFGPSRRDPVVLAAPFLAFSVLLTRAAQVLGETRFVPEWVGPQRRVPVFDVGALREFLDEPLRRLFLADLLSSYTHVASGTMLVKTSRGWRRRRFSELDPVRLAELARDAPEHERLLLYRRLGDLTLFLSGVFPDFAGRRLLEGPLAPARLHRALGFDAGRGQLGRPGVEESSGPIALLEALGRHSYRLAWEGTSPRNAGSARILREVSDRFDHARRILNFLTDRYLFPHREGWFPEAG